MDLSYSFVSLIASVSLIFMVWACVEVGSNDAANLVNAVFGSRILKRKKAVFIAGLFVVMGSLCSSSVLETVRGGIFDTKSLTEEGILSLFLASYLVNTVLLYSYSGYGLPVSTTATLVFSLAGGAFGVAYTTDVIYGETLLRVVLAVFVSIFLSGFAAYIVQKVFRAIIRKDAQCPHRVLYYGPWVGGFLISGLAWFMLIRGVRIFSLDELTEISLNYGLSLFQGAVVFYLFVCAVIWVSLLVLGKIGTSHLFHVTSIIGMMCMAFAFGQNDLANCASPGLASFFVWQYGIVEGSEAEIPLWALLACGLLIFLGMRTKRAQRVTRSEVNTASQQDSVQLYAPSWCRKIASFWLRSSKKKDPVELLTPEADLNCHGKKKHYDTLRASVILSVSASVIAVASGLGIPISTTYVSFAAVIATGWADNVFEGRGSSDLKLGRAIWVVTSWFMGAILAVISSAIIASIIFRLEVWGIIIAFAFNMALRAYAKKSSDRHEKTYHKRTKRKKNRMISLYSKVS